jgi:hypothetical protein
VPAANTPIDHRRPEKDKSMKLYLSLVFAVFCMSATGLAAADRAVELSKKQLAELLAHSATPQDHLRLAGHFEAKAKKFEVEAAEHVSMAKYYRTHPTGVETKNPMGPNTAAHCDFMAKSMREAAKNSRALAVMHERLAK